VVFDLPYSPGAHRRRAQFDNRYRNVETTPHKCQDDILSLYREGIAEAKRVLTAHKPINRMGIGQLWFHRPDKSEKKQHGRVREIGG